MKKKKQTVFHKIAQKGGKATFEKYGSEHYRKIALKSWRKRRAAQKALAKNK